MAAGDIYRVTAQQQTTDNDIYQWVWHYNQVNGTDVDLADLADAIIAVLDTAWANIEGNVHTTVEGETLEIALWDATEQEFNTMHTADLSGHLDGTGTGTRLPNQNAAVVKFFTALAKSIGKKFISGLVVTSLTGQSWFSTVITALALFAADFDEPVSVDTFDFDPGNFNTTTGVFHAWSQVVEALSLVRTQDRRIRGVGL